MHEQTGRNPLTFGEKAIEFHLNLNPPDGLPDGIEWINNFGQEDTQTTIRQFFTKYFSDDGERLFLVGINPGRFGAGLTGVGFTDPIFLYERCGIENSFEKKHELSSQFIYEVIEAYGGVESFYRRHFFTSILPLGLLKNGKNYNYYDDKMTLQATEPWAIKTLERQLEFGARRDKVICIGMGKNYKYLSELNARRGWFGEVIPLPHPRWVMQYRRKRMEEFVGEYLVHLSE